MFERLRRKGLALAVSALTVASLGIATPALAEDADTYEPDEAMLTKVIVAPRATDTSGDTYTIHFDGDGTVEESGDDLISDGVKQDERTIAKDDVVPAIPDFVINGKQLTDDNTLYNGQSAQAVVQVPMSTVLNGVAFPHAGVYTYRVTESSTTLSQDLTDAGYYINASKAAYILRVRVVNDESASGSGSTNATVVKDITFERVLDDDGRNTDIGKVDPTYPQTNDSGKIVREREDKVPADNKLAGDNADRGRDVYGFTFDNEYIKGGEFIVKKLVDGDFADKTKFFEVELVIHDTVSTTPEAIGCCVTYQIEGEGEDLTDNLENGIHKTLDNVYDIAQSSHSMAVFDETTGNATIKANLKEGSYIRITGVFGPAAADYVGPNGKDHRMILSKTGLLAGETFTVNEAHPGNYEPTAYVYPGTDAIDPRTMTADELSNAEITTIQKTSSGTLEASDAVDGSDTVVYVVNTLADSYASPTGIFINNLPYILMVGGPLAIFAVMFVSKRRRNAAA